MAAATRPLHHRVVTWWLLVIVVFAAPLIDSVAPVLPGEVVVAGAATSLAGALPVWAVVAVAAAGSLAGECVVLAGSRRLAGTRLGERLAGGPKAARIRRVLDRWGVGAVVVARFLPGGRTAAAAGFALRRRASGAFVVAAAVGSLAWSSYLVAVGSGVAVVI